MAFGDMKQYNLKFKLENAKRKSCAQQRAVLPLKTTINKSNVY